MKLSVKTILASGVMLFAVSANAADTYKLDPTHTAITWEVSHFGLSHPTGKFMNVDGTLVLDEANPENSTLNVTIPVNKMESGVPKLDEHMMKADFFDAEKFPTATFKSTKIVRTGDTAKVTGDLTLHGVTKPVVLDVKLNKILDSHPMTKKKVAGFSATTTIKRSDFGMGFGIPNVSDEVNLKIETEANIADDSAVKTETSTKTVTTTTEKK